MSARARIPSGAPSGAPSTSATPGRLAALWLRITDVWMPQGGTYDPALLSGCRASIGISYSIFATLALVTLAQMNGLAGFSSDDLNAVVSRLNLAGMVAVTLGVFLIRWFACLKGTVHLDAFFFLSTYVAHAYYTGGPASPIAVCAPAVVLAVLATLGSGAAKFYLGVVLALFSGMFALQAMGYEFPNVGTQVERDRFWLISVWSLAIFVFSICWSFHHARAQALETLEGANRDLEAATNAADAANRAQNAFLVNMSHEIRTPMTAVLGFADIASEQAADEQVSEEDRSALATIRRSAETLLKIVDDMLDLSRIEAGDMEIQATSFRLDEVVNAVMTLMRPLADAQQTPLVLERAAGVPDVIESDPLRLQQVLINLVGNAIKFSERGTVRIAVWPESLSGRRCVRFAVRDSGIGMTEEQVAGLFRPFAQAEASTARRFGGTGLGLAMCAALVERLGGSIHAQSRPGQGSTFFVDLPVRAPGSAPRPEPASPVPDPAQRGGTAGQRLSCRVLVVDDTHDNRRLLKHFLERAGADVSTAESGEDALQQFEAARRSGTHHDVIVMDIQMPGMDGFEARRALLERGCTAPIVALTAHALASERERCLSAGFDDYASKPIDRVALIQFVARNLSTARPARQETGQPAAAPDSTAQRVSRMRRRVEALVEWLTPPSERGQPGASRRIRTLLWVSVAPLPVLPVEAWFLTLVLPHEVTRIAIPCVLLALPLCGSLPFIYRWSGSVPLVTSLLFTYLTSVITMLTYITGGAGSVVAAWHVLVPMTAFAITGIRAAGNWALLSALINAGFWYAALVGASPQNYAVPERLPLGATFSNSGLAILVTVMALVHERARSEALETLGSANRWLQEARTRAERANRTKALFLANVGHELRAPMTAILGFADLLIDGRREAKATAEAPDTGMLASLDAIQKNGRRLLALINDLLDLAKIEAGGLQIEALEFDPVELIGSTLEPLRVAAQDKGLSFSGRLDTPLPVRALGDPLRIGQILQNLTDNAIKFTDAGAVSVSAGVRRADGEAWLRIEVTDTGCGVPADRLATLFRPFQQLDDSTSREQGGSGLGLALSQRLAGLMGGAIRVTSQPGGGSCFTLDIPLCEIAGAKTRDQLTEHREASTGRANRLKGLRLLLAEDGIDNQRLMTRVLRNAGAHVDIAENGRVAVERGLEAREKDRGYDVILMDIEMPELDGMEATRALRDAGYRAPILALTAHGPGAERARCLAVGFDGVAAKPVDWPTLFAQMEALVADPKEAEPQG